VRGASFSAERRFRYFSGNHTRSGVGEGVYARSRVIAYVLRVPARVQPPMPQVIQ
jgi:hypothetical protein